MNAISCSVNIVRVWRYSEVVILHAIIKVVKTFCTQTWWGHKSQEMDF